jgi:hypothetical protein
VSPSMTRVTTPRSVKRPVSAAGADTFETAADAVRLAATARTTRATTSRMSTFAVVREAVVDDATLEGAVAHVGGRLHTEQAAPAVGGMVARTGVMPVTTVPVTGRSRCRAGPTGAARNRKAERGGRDKESDGEPHRP